MLRKFAFCLTAAASVALPLAGAARAESFTTRIEPRPFYGAVVTLEEGVRVIRPLPPERQVIINPENTPLTLGFNDTRVYERRDIYNHNSGPVYGNGGPAIYGAPGFTGWGRGPFVGKPGFGHGGFGRGGHGGRVNGF